MTFHVRQDAATHKVLIYSLKEEGLSNQEISERLSLSTSKIRHLCKDADDETKTRWQGAYDTRNGKTAYRRYVPTGRQCYSKDSICRKVREK